MIVLKLGRGLLNSLEEPLVKLYHTWLSESARAHFATQLVIAQLRTGGGVRDRDRDGDHRVLKICQKYPEKEFVGPEAAGPTAARAAAAATSRATRGRAA